MGTERKDALKKKSSRGSSKVESRVLEETQRGGVGVVGGTLPHESRHHSGVFFSSVWQKYLSAHTC